MDRELVIMSRPAKLKERTPGHIMVAVSTPGGKVEAWGFYPNGVRDEVVEGKWHRYTRSTVIQINERQYRALKAAIGRWRKTLDKEYTLALLDCTSFVWFVVRAAGVGVPEDQAWPDDLGNEFMKMHGESWGRCLARSEGPKRAE